MENKVYDFNRFKDYIDFVGKVNYWVKGRLVICLLEKVVYLMLSLLFSRYVIVLNSEILVCYIVVVVN